MFWKNLVFLCTQKQTTPTALALSLGLARGSVTRWKNGSKPNDTTVRKIADYFGVPVEYFAEEHTKVKPSGNEEFSNKNIVKIIGRDGSYSEKLLSDEQINALKTLIEQLPDVPEDL